MCHLSLRDLQILDDRTAKKCERMEAAVREEEVCYWHNIAQLLEHNKVTLFQALISAMYAGPCGEELKNIP